MKYVKLKPIREEAINNKLQEELRIGKVLANILYERILEENEAMEVSLLHSAKLKTHSRTSIDEMIKLLRDVFEDIKICITTTSTVFEIRIDWSKCE